MTLYDQPPPHDLQAEESVVASLLLDHGLMARVAPLLDAGDFFHDAPRWVYQACWALYERDEPLNQVTVAHELDRRGNLEDVGGLTYLSELVLNLPTPVGAENYAALVKRDAAYRKMLDVAGAIAAVAYEARPDLEGAIARAEGLVYGLRAERKASDWASIRDFLDAYWPADAGEQPGDTTTAATGPALIKTGLSQLDAILTLKAGNLIIVAARTGVGKTSLMLNIGRNAALTQGARVAMFSLEMEGSELVSRLVSSEARVDHRKIERWTEGRTDALTEGEEARVMHALGLLGEADLLFDHCPGVRIEELRDKALKLAARSGVDLIVVDYVQLIGTSMRTSNRVVEMGHITGALKALAGLLGVPIIVGAQLSRETEKRADHRPSLADLRDSGSIEQDADAVVFIYREDQYTKNRKEWELQHPDSYLDPYPEGVAELIVAKQRSGPRGTVLTRFRDTYTRFEDFDIPAAGAVQMEAF